MPLASMLVREKRGNCQPELEAMLVHCTALANAVPIEFAFCSMELSSNDKDFNFMEIFLDRVTEVDVEWSTICSQTANEILSRTILATRTMKSSALDIRLQKLKEFRDAATTSSLGNKTIKHLAFGETLLAGRAESKDAFWEVVLKGGLSFSVDIHCEADVSMRAHQYFPVRDAKFFLHGYQITTVSDKSPQTGLTILKIELKKEGRTPRYFRHYCLSWTVHETPGKSEIEDPFFKQVGNMHLLLTHLCKKCRKSACTTGTGRKTPWIYVRDRVHNGLPLQAGILAVCFAIKMGVDVSTAEACSKLWHSVFSQLGDNKQSTDSSAPFPVDYSRFMDKFIVAVNCATMSTVGSTVLTNIAKTLTQDSYNVKESVAIMRDWLNQMRSNYDIVHSPAVCGHPITMKVKPRRRATAAAAEGYGRGISPEDIAFMSGELDESHRLRYEECGEPFFDLVPKLVTKEELGVVGNSLAEQQRIRAELLTRAHSAIAKATLLTVMLEDAMKFGKNVLETKREGVDFALSALSAVAKSVASVPFALAHAGLSMFGGTKHLVLARQRYVEIFHEVSYVSVELSVYDNAVAVLCSLLHPPGTRADTSQWSLVKCEEYVVSKLPLAIAVMTLKQLLDNMDEFTEPCVAKLLSAPRTAGMMIFFLKTIYHCYHLRCLRRQITLVTIAGEKNAGKTTLNREIFTDTVVTAPTGTGEKETTLYPSAYNHPNKSHMIFCDLPGSSDADTADISDAFFPLGDINVYLIPQVRPANLVKGSSLRDRIRVLLSLKAPCLICVTQADVLLKNEDDDSDSDDDDSASEEEKCAAVQQQRVAAQDKLKEECKVWRASELFGNLLVNQATLDAPKWDCEKEKPSAIVASLRTADRTLSVWMCAFEPKGNGEAHAREFLFNHDQVRKWVDEVSTDLAAKAAE
jgi:azurin